MALSIMDSVLRMMDKVSRPRPAYAYEYWCWDEPVVLIRKDGHPDAVYSITVYGPLALVQLRAAIELHIPIPAGATLETLATNGEFSQQVILERGDPMDSWARYPSGLANPPTGELLTTVARLDRVNPSR